MSLDTPHVNAIKQSVRVFADFSRCNFHIPCNYLVMISEIMDKTPVFSYVLLKAGASREFDHIVNIAECADRFHVVDSVELNLPNYEPDVNVIISDACRELHFSRSVKERLIIAKNFFSYNGEKRDIKYIMQFLRWLFTDIYMN